MVDACRRPLDDLGEQLDRHAANLVGARTALEKIRAFQSSMRAALIFRRWPSLNFLFCHAHRCATCSDATTLIVTHGDFLFRASTCRLTFAFAVFNTALAAFNTATFVSAFLFTRTQRSRCNIVSSWCDDRVACHTQILCDEFPLKNQARSILSRSLCRRGRSQTTSLFLSKVLEGDHA
jgi:hypothetical protein